MVDTNESGKPPSEAELEGIKAMFAQFQQYAPDFTGPITPKQSVEMVMRVIEEKSVEAGDGGTFISHKGNKQWL